MRKRMSKRLIVIVIEHDDDNDAGDEDDRMMIGYSPFMLRKGNHNHRQSVCICSKEVCK